MIKDGANEKIQRLERELREKDKLIEKFSRYHVYSFIPHYLNHEMNSRLSTLSGLLTHFFDMNTGDEKTEFLQSAIISVVEKLRDMNFNIMLLLTRRSVPLNKCIQSAVTIAALSHHAAYHIAYRLEDAGEIEVNASTAIIVLANLISNSGKAIDEVRSKNRGMPLESPPMVTIEASANANEIMVCVTDKGLGIPPEHLEIIWSPGFSTWQDCMGMGLFIVKTMVEQNGWGISVESKPKCTRFMLTIPLK